MTDREEQMLFVGILIGLVLGGAIIVLGYMLGGGFNA